MVTVHFSFQEEKPSIMTNLKTPTHPEFVLADALLWGERWSELSHVLLHDPQLRLHGIHFLWRKYGSRALHTSYEEKIYINPMKPVDSKQGKLIVQFSLNSVCISDIVGY